MISDEICWMMRTSFVRFARSWLRRSIVSWFRAISLAESVRVLVARPSCGRAPRVGHEISRAPAGICDSGIRSPLVFGHRHDAEDVRGPELEDALHPDHRRDGLDLHVHRVEDRPAGLGVIELQLEIPRVERLRVDQPDGGLGILLEVALGLVEELVGERDVVTIDVVDLRDGAGIGRPVRRARHDVGGDHALHGRFDLVGQLRHVSRSTTSGSPRPARGSGGTPLRP